MAKDKSSKSATTTRLADEPPVDGDGLWTAKQAAAFIGIQKSSFDAAIKRSELLGNAVVKDKYPGLEIPRTRIDPVAVRMWMAERQASGGTASRGGMKKFSGFLAEDEVERAEHAVSAELGREFTLKRTYKNRSKEEGGEGEVEDQSGNGLEVSSDQEATFA